MAVAGVGGAALSGVAPASFPRSLLVVSPPLALPSPISMARVKKRDAKRCALHNQDEELSSCAEEGNNPDPGALVLMVSTGALAPKRFLTSRMNSAKKIRKIKLIHSMGSCVVALGQPNDLHGRTFAFVAEQVGDQLPSTFLEPTNGGALVAF